MFFIALGARKKDIFGEFTHNSHMKRVMCVLAAILCVIICLFACPVRLESAFAFEGEQLEFFYAGRVFKYNLASNIKKSDRFDLNYEINKYNRFGSVSERQLLLKQMLDAGFEQSVALNYIFPHLDQTVQSIAANIFVAPSDARLSINTGANKVFNITDEIVGISLNKQDLYNQICSAYLKGEELKFNLSTTLTTPKITRKYYEKFTNLRADFSTDFSSSSADRKHNIKNALNALNKFTLAPNQVFSFNKVVGRRTQENGYREAKIIVNNEYVDGLGGGVCQVSTTLYNAALLAGLNVVEANKHSKQIGYVKYGFDAMVNFGSSDLKFVNNTGERLTIVATAENNHARIRIYGEDMAGVSYKLVNEIVSVTEPEEQVIVDTAGEYASQVYYTDESFYIKKAIRGMEVKSYRQCFANGKLVETKLLRFDKFKAQNAIKVCGAHLRESEHTNLIPQVEKLGKFYF